MSFYFTRDQKRGLEAALREAGLIRGSAKTAISIFSLFLAECDAGSRGIFRKIWRKLSSSDIQPDLATARADQASRPGETAEGIGRNRDKQLREESEGVKRERSAGIGI